MKHLKYVNEDRVPLMGIARPWQIELRKVNQCPQRQDSLCEQLEDLIIIANKFGFYDAADYLKNQCKR